MKRRRLREEILLAKERDQLIQKELALKQLSYLMITMRQKLLALPLSIGDRFGDREVSIREVVEYSRRLINETLVELSKLLQCAEPDWLKRFRKAQVLIF